MSDEQGRGIRASVEFAAADVLEREDPGYVARCADQLQAAAEGDVRGRVTKSVAYIRRLQELTIERPELGIAVARSLGLEHIVEDLLDGQSVEGVPGIGSDGVEMPHSKRHHLRRRGKWVLAASVLVLLVEAVVADGVPSVVVYLWTVVGLGMFFLGWYLVMLRE